MPRTPRAARTRHLLALACALASLGGGCGALNRHQEQKVPQLGTWDPHQPRELAKVTLPPYVIEPPDELEVIVRPAALEVPLATAIVRQDGVIDLGLAGEVYVSGLTVQEAELKVARHLAPIAQSRELREPVQVAIRVLNSTASKHYYVIGTVTSQGQFPITGNETVLDGILRAGLRVNSLPEKAYLARPAPLGGADQILRIDWERIKVGDTFTNYQLMPGDRIIVPGTRPPGLLGTLFGG